ncbi:hypothetical protein BDQ12DRAFT_721424 [Crucibulum laeve]|uniref:Uncharacterized protein n=1 Tax=Crucibulum laeve TaxID=68775 RepID=A0A5C3M652_9AGAR|nr:hypothetical protein BDQ12DRAFT_721424 [Crucibulum laeve]
MAQYFPHRRHASSSTVAKESLRLQEEPEPWASLQLSDSSIYVFPNPSSMPPSPSQISDISVPTDFSLSAVSLSRDPSPNANIQNFQVARSPMCTLLTPLSDGQGLEDDEWGWEITPPPERSLLIGAEEERERHDHWEIVARRRAREEYMNSLSSLRTLSSHSIALMKHNRQHSNSSNIVVTTPHPRIHIPFLSFFISFLSVDDTTLHLLTQSPSHSSLFPGHVIPAPLPLESNDFEPKNEGLHGVEKLLSREDESRTLKDGMAVASDSLISPLAPFLVSPFRLSGLWDMVNELVTSSGKALCEVLQPR